MAALASPIAHPLTETSDTEESADEPLTAEPFTAEPFTAEPSKAYRAVRSWTENLREPLEVEDQVVQSMPDASPVKWHLAHTTWFFETFLLIPHLASYKPFETQYAYLFNSYYNTLGQQFSRPHRGLLSRPTVAEVTAYRQHVDRHMDELLAGATQGELGELSSLMAVGLNHEQQHQELILTDLKHLFAQNPLFPVYRPARTAPATAVPELTWHAFDEDLHWIGDPGEGGFAFDNFALDRFAFDNEGPRHRVFVESFRVGSRLVTCGEYLEFIADGGYQRPELWLSDGWSTVRERGWQAPLYWQESPEEPNGWRMMSLAGARPVRRHEPVCHVSLYEADAYARWAGCRLPTEAEWEIAATRVLGTAGARGGAAPGANFVEQGHYHPRPMGEDEPHGQFLGDVWEWTRSPYSPYPGYEPPPGALGEYNSKFMNNQIVLRGGSCATPRSHIRSTYRNFFPSDTRWQFSGIRLAQDGGMS